MTQTQSVLTIIQAGLPVHKGAWEAWIEYQVDSLPDGRIIGTHFYLARVAEGNSIVELIRFETQADFVRGLTERNIQTGGWEKGTVPVVNFVLVGRPHGICGSGMGVA